VIQAWPDLPVAIRAAVLAMIDTLATAQSGEGDPQAN
jgi:hypothetical protein